MLCRFRWVHCQLEMLRTCLRRDIQSILNALPKTLDETYERILEGIPETRRDYAQRLFQFLAVSVRPFGVEELADILAFKFEAGVAPKFEESCREADAEEALLSTCSTMIVIIPSDGVECSWEDLPARVVQFAHFSVQEFITSERFQINSKQNVAHFHVIPGPAHTLLAHTCLSLLQSDDCIDEDAGNLPLVTYAAMHWHTHAHFEDEPMEIKGAIEGLFDIDKPYFARWFQLYDPYRFSLTDPKQNRAISLHYSARLGLSQLTRHLSTLHPHCINAVLGSKGTPLKAASSCGSLKTVKVLFEHGANVNAQGGYYGNALQAAAYQGSLEIVDFLLQHGADVNAQGGYYGNALQAAHDHDANNIIQLLLKHEAIIIE